MRRGGIVALALLSARCSWCAAPKPTPEEDLADRDAAPHAEEHAARCGVQSKVVLPGRFELGRVTRSTSRVLVGARREGRLGVVDTDGLGARFTEVGDAVGDAPPALPVVDGERVVTVEYEGTPRHLVLRDATSPATPIAELAREPPDESLAYDAAIMPDKSIVVVWDAPADEGSAVYAAVVRGGAVSETVRLSPKDVDADTPRIAGLGPTIVATWLAHRPLPKADASVAALEGPGQDLDRAWVEMLAFDSTLHPTSPLRHLTPDASRVTSFDVKAELTPPSVTVVARDALELQPGQGGTALLVRVHGLEVDAPVVLAEHVGRGLPLFLAIDKTTVTLYDDASARGRFAGPLEAPARVISPEPALDAARPLAALSVSSSTADVLVAPEGEETELRVVRCSMAALP